ncbi:MAG TPA: alpha/beta hydrolase, partial [Bryobacteraceae bacterium]|nr:alpha/beta hydrolase [Bryobacteraceae bacterium]
MNPSRLFSRWSGLFAIALALAAPAMCGQRVVDLTAADGTKLKATYFDPGKPGPGVLLLHQCNRDRKVWDGLATQLSGAGIHVLTVDNRGFGESGGTPHDRQSPADEGKVETEKWPGDFDVAIAYLESQPGVTRGAIGAGGASCGVNNSVQLARRHPEVVSLVLLSGPTNLDGRNYLRNTAKTPVFFAVADDDEFGANTEIDWLYALTSNPGKKYVRYAKGGHGADMFPAHPELPGLITDWYVTTLIKTPGRAPAEKSAPAISEQARNLETIEQPGGPAKVTAKLAAARKTDLKATLFPEAPVNIMGYEHLQAGRTQEAIEIFKLNVAAYPESPNTYDSLSDGYIASGQKDLALQNVKKALELLPNDTKDPKAFRE